MDVNLPEIVAEVEAAFARYEAALVGNDTATLQELFWRSPHTIRYGTGKVGRQMQTWVRFPDGWHVVAAHVSLIDA